MAFNTAGLVKNITESASFFGAIFGGKNSGKKNQTAIEEDNPVLAQIERGNWIKTLPYSFRVINIKNNSAAEKFSDFILPINPSEITQDENFAITIKPTQGGTVVQHSGNKYKELIIAGTTGLHPWRGSGGVSVTTGLAIAQPPDLKHSSGFEVFLLLRNWFRAYYEHKKIHPETARPLRLVFQNFKDGEFLIVELLKFSMKRTATRSFLYDYSLIFKVLGSTIAGPKEKKSFLEHTDEVLNAGMDAIDIARGTFLRAQNVIRQVDSNVDQLIFEPMRRLALATKAAIGVPFVAADMWNGTKRKFDTFGSTFNLLSRIKELKEEGKKGVAIDPRIQDYKLPGNIRQAAQTSGIDVLLEDESDIELAISASEFPQGAQDELEQDKENSKDIPREFFEDLRDNLIRVRDNIADSFNLGSSAFDAQYERTATLKADIGKVPTDEEFEVLGGFNSAIRGVNLYLSTTDTFKSTYQQRISSVQKTFDNQLDIKVESAVREIILEPHVTLERLALQELDNTDRWVEIAELNDLKPPYIVQSRSEAAVIQNVLAPGQTILIPTPISEGFSDVVTTKELPINQDLTEIERNLGIDLKLTKEFDLELTNRGDIQLARSAENVAQAIIVKLALEKGDLLKHPNLGIGAVIGSKVSPVTELRTSIVETLQGDPRFQSISNLALRRENNEIRISFDVKLKNIDLPVPIDLKL